MPQHLNSAPGPRRHVMEPLGADETIIVGAGIAGLACARRLHDAGRRFLLVSEDVGGRLHRSRDGTVNLGAYYVRADYTHVTRYVRRGRRINRLVTRRYDGDAGYGYWNPRLLLHSEEAGRFLRLLRDFRRHYDTLKHRTIHLGQAAAIRSDSMLAELYRTPATEFIREHRLEALARSYLAPGLHGTAFVSLRELTAFTLLLGALPALIPTYEFTLELNRLVDGFTSAIVADSVTAVGAEGSRYRIETKANGTLSTQRLVIATPTAVTGRLLGLPATKRPVSAHMFHVRGSLRYLYQRADIHLFPETDPTFAIARQGGGTVLIGCKHRQPELDRFFTDWEVLEHKHWNPAFHIVGDDLLEAEPSPDLHLDHHRHRFREPDRAPIRSAGPHQPTAPILSPGGVRR